MGKEDQKKTEDEKRLLVERMSGAKVFRIIWHNGMVGGGGIQWLIRTKKSKRHKGNTHTHTHTVARPSEEGLCEQARNGTAKK